MADTKRRIKNEEIKKATTEPKAVSQSTAMQERMESVSRKILITARNELYMKMRFLDVALSCMPFIPDTGADGMGTGGTVPLLWSAVSWGDCSGKTALW